MALFPDLIKLILGTFFILFGLKYFKITVIFSGIFTGFIIGLLIGLILQFDLFLAGIIFALIFGFLAWPFQKLIVYVFCGLVCSILGVIIGLGGGFPFNAIIILFLIFFTIGVWLAVKFYEIIIIITFSFAGSQIIFNTYYSIDYTRIIKEWSPSYFSFFDSLKDLAENFLF